MQLINDEINSNQTKLQVITSNRERIAVKKQMLIENLEKYNAFGKLDLRIYILLIQIILNIINYIEQKYSIFKFSENPKKKILYILFYNV